MTEQNQKQMGTTLWGIADQLRGAMNADNYEAAAKKELGMDFPDNREQPGTTPLQLWYNNNPGDSAEFEKQMRLKVHYVIQPQYLWGSIAEMARTQDGELLHTLDSQEPATGKKKYIIIIDNMAYTPTI